MPVICIPPVTVTSPWSPARGAPEREYSPMAFDLPIKTYTPETNYRYMHVSNEHMIAKQVLVAASVPFQKLWL